MAKKIGSNWNNSDDPVVTTVTLNSVDATDLVSPNPDRIRLEIYLDAGTFDVNAFIRPYAASVNDNKAGIVLTRHTLGNENLFHPCWIITRDNGDQGAFSGITDVGEVDVHVLEW